MLSEVHLVSNEIPPLEENLIKGLQLDPFARKVGTKFVPTVNINGKRKLNKAHTFVF